MCKDLCMPDLCFLVFLRAAGLWWRWDLGHVGMEAPWPWMARAEWAQWFSPVVTKKD